ncbi:MAG: glucosidase [Trichocoleus desertorum ATA4-8-CV12]|jgi:hypothetical protein|nr:glucosidase [Trichocoleus desertorum ATA4-8-CV12]
MTENTTAEAQRLEATRQRQAHWRRWGPYLSDRQWGTVREDYSASGAAWDYFTHDQARSRAYRWGEDGIAGISDNHQRLCFAIALWNGKDAILKERLFGLTGKEGNHGEDVKEYYFYLDNTPTHSYMKCLYKYPHQAFPYEQLVAENACRGRDQLEFELLETGIFDEEHYFDVLIEYAKAAPEDILIRITITNRGPEAQSLHLLPTLWFRNTWSWNTGSWNTGSWNTGSWSQEQACPSIPNSDKPLLSKAETESNYSVIAASHPSLGEYWLYCDSPTELLFTENETNAERIFGTPNVSAYLKDGINNYVVQGEQTAVNPELVGTKAAAHYILQLPAGETQTIQLRLNQVAPEFVSTPPLGAEFEQVFGDRQQEADEFYQHVCCFTRSPDLQNIQRQAFAGLLWSKQFYYYVVDEWLKNAPAEPSASPERLKGRNSEWIHLFNDDILSMPDKWEYPWFAAWDLAFHVIPIAMIDPELAKYQLDRLTREWYMHPNGQLPAYEWALGDVNPPVHAWAAWRIYKIEQKLYGRADPRFLERVFQKLLLNFTWWVNRKDAAGNNVFQGGFLGLDNIGVFDRSSELPTGGRIDQSDGTSWMGMYSLHMLAIALELSKSNPIYEDIASKFFEHFLYIADAMNRLGKEGASLWDEADGFYYDVLHFPDGHQVRLKVRSIVGLIPLFAVEPIEAEIFEQFPDFWKRTEWFIRNRPDLTQNIACMKRQGVGDRRLLAIVYRDKLRRILEKMLDENEFLSPYGIRALSRYHAEHPYIFEAHGQQHRVDYEPAESTSALFGGNSNWRGPIWFPINFLLIESLQKFHHYLGDDFKVECPTGSGQWMNLWEVASEISQRLMRIFAKDASGRRPVYGDTEKFQTHPHWQDLILFYEYFHGDNGAGIGASHQTGWTALIAKLIQQVEEYEG